MTITEATDLLARLLDSCPARGRLWEGEKAARIYLEDPDGRSAGAYITVDRDGDLVGEAAGKLSRAKSARVWSPWINTAKALGKKLYA